MDLIKFWLSSELTLDLCLSARQRIPSELRVLIQQYAHVRISDFTIRHAVRLWMKNETEGLLTYGHISHWNTENVRDMSRLFEDCETFNVPLNQWNVTNVLNMHNMFCRAKSFNQPLTDWNVQQVTNMKQMFYGATSFNQPLNDWKLEKITNISNMFYRALSFNQPLDNWHQSMDPLVVKVDGMLNGATAFTHFPHIAIRFPFTNKTLQKKIHSLLHGHNDYQTERFWYGPMSEWDTSRVTDMSNLFNAPCGDASFNIDIGGWDVRKVTKMTKMFAGSAAFNQPLDHWKLDSIIDMSGMFYNARSFNQPLDAWHAAVDPSKVIVKYMFFGANSFTHFPKMVNRYPFTNDTLRKTIKSLYYGENDCLTERFWFGPIGEWDTSRVTDMSKLFQNLDSFNEDISSWNVGAVTNMSQMFSGARSFNRPLNSWDVANVTDMKEIFQDAVAFNQPLDQWQLCQTMNK